MTIARTKILIHVTLVALGALALVFLAPDWLPAQLAVGALGISSGVLTVQVMWDEFWATARLPQQ